VAAMICPIGIGGIRSKLPAAIAVAVSAQLITLDEALSASATHGMLSARNAG
jgi:xanthine/CO dehydrogenase XdhC/CoxF family maturation factor